MYPLLSKLRTRQVFLNFFFMVILINTTSCGNSGETPTDADLDVSSDADLSLDADVEGDTDVIADADLDTEEENDSDGDGDSGPECVPPEGDPTFDEWGGDERVELEATGFFWVTEICGRYWFVTPGGHPFYSLGVNHITSRGDEDRKTGEWVYEQTVAEEYESVEHWADTTVERLQGWGFNTAGAWSNMGLMLPRMPFTLAFGLAGTNFIIDRAVDFYDPRWEINVNEAAKEAANYRDEANLIGYFIDNELRWGPDYRGSETLIMLYLSLGADAGGKRAAVDFLLDDLGDIDSVNEFFGTEFADRDDMLDETNAWLALGRGSELAERLTSEFLTQAADRYYSVTSAAIRKHDPNHLILGSREVSIFAPIEVYRAAAPHVDVISINNYVFLDIVRDTVLAISGAPNPDHGFAELHEEIDAPILIGEFGFRAEDSGLPNSWPPIYPTLKTQEERAAAYVQYAEIHQPVPWIVGYHWFQWLDQPVGGRFDGEDCNWGLVSELDVPYSTVTDAMTTSNAQMTEYLLVEP